MTNEEFQKLVLDKLGSLEADIAKLPTREELNQVVAGQQKDVMAMLQIMDKKLSIIQDTQTTQGESINILALRQLQTEAEVAAIKKAK